MFVLLFCAGRAAAFFAGGVAAEVTTVDDETIWLEDLKFSTPRDASSPGRPEFNLSARPLPPDFEAIQQITFARPRFEILGSDPSAMESYVLGTVRRAIPPPPDWMRARNQLPPWTRPVPAEDLGKLPYINQAIFAWVEPSTSTMSRGEQVVLFRQAFEVRDLPSVVRGTLRVALNARPVRAFFNQAPLHMGGNAETAIYEFEVTPLLHAGENLFAIQLEEIATRPELRYGLAFHLELQRREAGAPAAERPEPGSALLTTDDGDRLWGQVLALQGDRVQFSTRHGVLNQPLAEIGALLFPWGWQPAPARRGLFGVGAASSAVGTVQSPVGLPLRTLPDPLQDCLLLTEGRLTTAKPAYERAGVLHFEGYEGAQYAMPMPEVLGIFLPLPLDGALKRPDDASAVLYARVETRSGERVSGLVRSLNGSRLVLESGSGDFLEIPATRLASVSFPFHARKLGPGLPIKVGVLPQAQGQEALQPHYRRDAMAVHSAAFAIDAESVNVGFETLADAAQLRPQVFPVLVSVDPLGEFMHTVRSEGDARDALLQYVEDGGIIIALSRGGALRTAVINAGETTLRSANEPPLAEALGLTIVRPSGPPVEGISAFDHPPNALQTIHFQRASRVPQGLLDLPRRIQLAPMVSAPYFPMVEAGGRGTVVYEMSDEAGTVHGPVLSITVRGRGSVMVVDHLLWDSRPGDRPFAESILPSLLRWGLINAGLLR